MKFIIILIAICFSVNSFAQKNDTLIVPIGKYKFIKVGDKVYKLETNLTEVTVVKNIWGILDSSTYSYPLPSIRYYDSPEYLPGYNNYTLPGHGLDIFKNY